MSKVFKVYTKWTGYSEIIVEAKNEKDAEILVYEGNYDPSDCLLYTSPSPRDRG